MRHMSGAGRPTRTTFRLFAVALAPLLLAAAIGRADAQAPGIMEPGDAVVTGFSGTVPPPPGFAGDPIDGTFIDVNGASMRIRASSARRASDRAADRRSDRLPGARPVGRAGLPDHLRRLAQPQHLSRRDLGLRRPDRGARRQWRRTARPHHQGAGRRHLHGRPMGRRRFTRQHLPRRRHRPARSRSSPPSAPIAAPASATWSSTAPAGSSSSPISTPDTSTGSTPPARSPTRSTTASTGARRTGWRRLPTTAARWTSPVRRSIPTDPSTWGLTPAGAPRARPRRLRRPSVLRRAPARRSGRSASISTARSRTIRVGNSTSPGSPATTRSPTLPSTISAG